MVMANRNKATIVHQLLHSLEIDMSNESTQNEVELFSIDVLGVPHFLKLKRHE